MPLYFNYFKTCFNELLNFLTNEEKKENKVVLDEIVHDKYNYCLYYEPDFNYTLDKFLEYLNHKSYISPKIENINEYMQYIKKNISKQYELKINRYNLYNMLSISFDTEKAYYLSGDHNSYIRLRHQNGNIANYPINSRIAVKFLTYEIKNIKIENTDPTNVSFRLLVTF